MIAILTDPGIGGTFLTWTIYYLSGKTHYFSAKSQSITPLVDNPLTDKNAHNFVPNQPDTKNELEKFLPLLINTEECMYMHQFRTGTKESVQQLCQQSTSIIVLSLHFDQILYQCSYKPRNNAVPAWGSNTMLTHSDSIYEDFTNHFFKESKQQWQKENLNEIWDKREFIALNYNPFWHDSILNYIDTSTHYYHIDALNAWTRLEHHVQDLFEYLNLPLDQSRYQLWLLVYNQWKNKHLRKLKFSQNFKNIVDNIFLGVDFDLTQFDLDIQQEAAIQHFLIYKHNLNLKTWQLTKFLNTKQLHDLLEPNIHDLTKSLIS